jgi:hypothetical protein
MSAFAKARRSSDAAPRAAAVGLLAVGLFGLVMVAWVGLARASKLRNAWPAEADTFYLPPSSALRAVSLGHTELFADVIHARANVYFGTQLHARVPSKWLVNYLNTAIDLDQNFERIYLAGASMLIYNGQRITPEMVLSAIQILERGRKVFPFNYEFPFQIGFHYLFELPQDAGEDDPRVPLWRQRGVEMLRQSALYEGVPYYIPNLVARMLTKGGANDMALRHLEQAYAVASSPEVRNQIRGRLVALRGERFSEQLEQNQRSFAAMIAERFPYAPEAFSLVTGPRMTAIGIVYPPRPPSEDSRR